MIPFRLQVDSDLSVTLLTLDRPVSVDGRRLKAGLRMKGGVIDADAARFSISQPVSVGDTKTPTTEQINAALPPVEILVSELPGVSVDKKTRRRNKRNADAADYPELTNAVLTSRARTIRRKRMLNPDACELLARAKAGRQHMWNINPGDPQFGLVTLAYGEKGWTPPFDRPDKVRDEAAYAVHQYLETPSIPITVNITKGGLGIIGPRPRVLSVARHIAICTAILTSPKHLELAIMAGMNVSEDWAWSQRLPHARPSEGQALPLLVIDGVQQIGANELRSLLAGEDPLGAIVIEPELGELPSICSTVMELRADGTAALMDFRKGSTINRRATPVGMTATVAATAARDIENAAYGSSRQARQAPKRKARPEIAVPDHIKRPEKSEALPQRKR
jgi:DNA segregation ATPase FtsK/SpoIIIE-like protein